MTDEEKQHTPEFERCIEEVMAQGHEKGNAFAICTATFQRAGKPIFVSEAVSPQCYYMIGELKHILRSRALIECMAKQFIQ